jgi:hypothetical protein
MGAVAAGNNGFDPKKLFGAACCCGCCWLKAPDGVDPKTGCCGVDPKSDVVLGAEGAAGVELDPKPPNIDPVVAVEVAGNDRPPGVVDWVVLVLEGRVDPKKPVVVCGCCCCCCC